MKENAALWTLAGAIALAVGTFGMMPTPRDQKPASPGAATYLPASGQAAGVLKCSSRRPEGAPRGTIMGPSSEFIEIAILDNGEFTMGVPNGPVLLYGHPDPWSSYTTIRVDGADYINYDGELFGTTVQAPSNSGSSNEGAWQIGATPLQVKQRITLVTGTSTNKQDTYLIQYVISNTDAAPRTIALRIMFDTDLADQDGAPFQVPGTGPVTQESQWDGSQIPGYFFVVNDLNDPQVTCQGTLLGGQIQPLPQRFQIADWDGIKNVPFDYTTNPAVSITDDSAYAVTWMERAVSPGQTVTFSTYYGLGGIGVDPTPPLVTALSAPQFLECVDGTLTPNPFQITLLLSNTLPDATQTVTGIQATLAVPSGLQIEGSSNLEIPDMPLGETQLATWNVRADNTATGELPYSIALTSSNAGSKTIPGQITVPEGCVPQTTGGLNGAILVGDPSFAAALDGPDVVSMAINLRDPYGNLMVLPLQGPAYSIADLEPGLYEISAAVLYRDHIQFDATVASFGCTQPSQSIVTKQTASAPRTVAVAAGPPQTLDILFPPPLVFLHGALECYQWWTSPDLTDAWDNAARKAGFFSFTPNYSWWGNDFSWPGTADQVAQQVQVDLQGLHQTARFSSGVASLPWTLVAHDMGGLVARVLTSGNHRSDPFLTRLGALYLLGAPNSGSDLLLGGGSNSLLSMNSIIRRFNDVYPDFGEKTGSVYAIGGSSGWWGDASSDGPLLVASAFNVARLACGSGGRGQGCTPYVYLAFDSGQGHLFEYGHYDLGAPPSTEEILRGVILPASQTGRSPDPESPAGGTIWGTGARTTGTTQGNIPGLRTHRDYPFEIGSTDGMAIAAWVTDGSADFQVLEPGGRAAGASFSARSEDLYPGYLFTAMNPAPGIWTLRVIPGASGATFSATAAENGLFGILGYAGQSAFYPGQAAPVRVEREGAYEGVSLDEVTATLFDLSGGILQEIVLQADGDAFSGSLEAPGAVGSYPVTFQATGKYGGKPFVRNAFERINVIPSPQARTRFFAGTFSDRGSDTDGDGKFDAVVLDIDVAPPASGTYAVSADIYDGSARWLAYASNSFFAQGTTPARTAVAFSLAGILCHQLSGPLEIRNLTATDASTLAPIDLWTPGIPTQTYDSGTFDCNPSTDAPSPILRAVHPDQGIRGQALALLLSGSNLGPGSGVSLGSGITVSGTALVAEGVLQVSIFISTDAAPGLRDITVTNPEAPAVQLTGAFEVKASSTPKAAIVSPHDGDWVKGAIIINASASSDLRVTRVDFLLDGQVQQSDTEFPFTSTWDTTAAAEGSHTLSAVALDESGQLSTPAPLAVIVDNIPLPGDCDGNQTVSIGEVQKAINMFLGVIPPACGVDCNGDGSVSIGEVQKVINGFLGLASSCG